MGARSMLIAWIIICLAFTASVGVRASGMAANPADSKSWGEAHTLQYESYLLNYRQIPQPFGGSDARSRLDMYPSARGFYAGLSFAIEFNASRGHVYSLQDVIDVKRPKAAAVCLTCKTSALPQLVEKYGEKGFFSGSFDKLAKEAEHPIGCANCHDPESMDRVITNPALEAALAKAGKDPEVADQSEMRKLVCAQCHVEYYFLYSDFVLTLPWDNGTSPQQIEQYYESIGFTDWKHAVSGIPLLKVQHPEYETFTDSIHDMMGLSCADCHMPAQEKGGAAYTSHWWTSPLNHISESPCLMCHDGTAEELKQRVIGLQEEAAARIDSIGEELAAIHLLVGSRRASLSEEGFDIVAELVRKAQFRLDWVYSENSTGFHNNSMLMGLLDEAEGLLDEAGKALE